MTDAISFSKELTRHSDSEQKTNISQPMSPNRTQARAASNHRISLASRAQPYAILPTLFRSKPADAVVMPFAGELIA